jgi:hypothetical protein
MSRQEVGLSMPVFAKECNECPYRERAGQSKGRLE